MRGARRRGCGRAVPAALERLVPLSVALALAAGTAACGGDSGDADASGTPSALTLESPDAFADIADGTERAGAIFTEMGKVLKHPRCVNCHPAGERPLQGDDSRPHEPPVVRGASGMGEPGMLCLTCHQSENVRVADDWSMPGHPSWHLAPASMAWAGKPLAEICAQLKDPARNGGMDLEALVTHMGEDALVGWGWRPGAGRERAPGTQARLGELTRAWVDAGAACPASD